MKSIMSRNTKRLSHNLRSVAIVFLFLVFMCWMKADPVSGGTSEIVYVDAGLNVKWSITTPKGDYKYEGMLKAECCGTMAETKTASAGKREVSLNFVKMYLPQKSLTIHYSYEEKKYYLGPLKPNQCQERLKNKVYGRFSSEESGFKGLEINRLTSMYGSLMKDISPAGKEFAAPALQAVMKNTDYFNLGISGPGEARMSKNLQGKRLQMQHCSYENYEKTIPLFDIGLHMALPPSKTIQGSRGWSSKSETSPPSFSVSLSDMKGAKPLKPANDGKDVTYTVHWQIGAEIEDKDKKCEKIRNDIKWLEKIIETYLDKKLREDIKKQYGDNAIREYQKAVEQKVVSSFKNPITGKLSDIKAFMETDPHCTPGTGCGPGENEPTIDTSIGGKTVHLISYDKNGNTVDMNISGIGDLEAGWQSIYGKCGGINKFDGVIQHEKTHVRDLVTKGYPKTIDDFADYEVRGFGEELAERRKTLRDMGC